MRLEINLFVVIFVSFIARTLPHEHKHHEDWFEKPTKELKSCLSPELEDEERATCRFFAAVIDAGSTGTRLHLFEFSHDPEHDHSPFKVESEFFKEAKPGLSSFANEPLRAAESIRELIDAAREVIPSSFWSHTPIAMKATAGLRLLPDDQADAILLEVENELKQSGLLMDEDSVGILSGTDEGVFGWFTLNYLTNKLKFMKENVQKTAVALDLGGGSTQITFAPKDFNSMFNEKVKRELFSHTMRVFGNKIHLYTHSYLGNGLVAARLGIGRLLKADSELEMATHCFPKGHILTDWDYAGNGWTVKSTPEAGFENCLKSTQEYVRKTKVQKTPEIANRDIYVFAYFYDRAEQANLLDGRTHITVGDYATAANKVCAIPSNQLGEEHWRPWQCLDLCYIYSLLRDGYGLKDEQKIYPTKKLQKMELSWALGASYHLLNSYHEKQNTVNDYSCDEPTTTKSKNKTATNATYISQLYEFLTTKTTQLLSVFKLIS